MRRQEPVEEANGVYRGPVGDRLNQMGQADQDQEYERDRGEQRVEGQGAGQERNVVFVCRLQGTGEKTGG
jgi:hypothetical protein